MFDIRAVTSSQRGIIQGKSPLAVIGTIVSLPDFGSSSWISPACSKTTVLLFESIDLTSK